MAANMISPVAYAFQQNSFVSGVQGEEGTSKAATAAAQGKPGRSFESVLQQHEPLPPSSLAQNNTGSELESIRLDLMEKYKLIPFDGAAKADAFVPELLEARTHLPLLREAMSGLGSTARGADLQSSFSRLETEWYNVEKIMKSNTDFSQGELLSLQARLYQVSQHMEVMSKVVDQMTGGIKTVLSTNV